MEQYIPKSALVAEFNRLIAELVEKGEGTMFEQGRISAFKDAKLFLDTLEVKEVDLDKEIDLVEDKYRGFNSLSRADVIAVAKHFFEFGLKVAQKGE